MTNAWISTADHLPPVGDDGWSVPVLVFGQYYEDRDEGDLSVAAYCAVADERRGHWRRHFEDSGGYRWVSHWQPLPPRPERS